MAGRQGFLVKTSIVAVVKLILDARIEGNNIQRKRHREVKPQAVGIVSTKEDSEPVTIEKRAQHSEGLFGRRH